MAHVDRLDLVKTELNEAMQHRGGGYTADRNGVYTPGAADECHTIVSLLFTCCVISSVARVRAGHLRLGICEQSAARSSVSGAGAVMCMASC